MPLPTQLISKQKIDNCESSKNLCNRYKILETIGVGTYGTVSRVQDSISNTVRALKCINIPNGENDKQLADALQEAKLLANLTHPHVVKLMDAFQEHHAFYIVMEYCASGTLDECISTARDQKSIFPNDQICCWITQLGFALEYIHSKRILHRDLKTKYGHPHYYCANGLYSVSVAGRAHLYQCIRILSQRFIQKHVSIFPYLRNIFLSAADSEGDEPWPDLKIGDFGISRTLFESADLASTCIGTPYYFSPEVFKQSGYNHKADLWAIGCILYELSSLSHPFVPAENLAQLMHRVVTKEPSYDKWTSPESAKTLCKELLNKNPQKRPDAKQMLLNSWLSQHQRDFKQRHLSCISQRK